MSDIKTYISSENFLIEKNLMEDFVNWEKPKWKRKSYKIYIDTCHKKEFDSWKNDIQGRRKLIKNNIDEYLPKTVIDEIKAINVIVKITPYDFIEDIGKWEEFIEWRKKQREKIFSEKKEKYEKILNQLEKPEHKIAMQKKIHELQIKEYAFIKQERRIEQKFDTM